MTQDIPNIPGVTPVMRYNLKFAKINPLKIDNFSGLESYDALLIEDAPNGVLIDFIRKLYSAANLAIALKPRLLVGTSRHRSSLSAYFDDVVKTFPTVENEVYKICEINNALDELNPADYSNKKQITVGVIDGDETFLKDFSVELERYQDFSVEWTATTKKNAIDKLVLASRQVDVLIGNIDLTEQPEEEVLHTINKAGIHNLVILSDKKEDLEKAFMYSFKYGVVDYIKKPVLKEDLDRIHERLAHRLKRTGRVKINEESNFLWKVLAYMYSRSVEKLKPIPNLYSVIGYSYPMLTSVMTPQIIKGQLNTLHKAVKQGYLKEDFFDAVYLCAKCSSAALQYREICPKCQSSNLKQQDLIHHFRCAYVGPRSDFQPSGDIYDLVCPKCDKRLKHIGVDYDKPAVVYDCLSCHHVFQDPIISAKCLTCDHENETENLVRNELYTYTLQPAAINFIKGQEAFELEDDYEESPRQIYFFRLLLNEINRQKQASYKSCLAGIKLTGISFLYENVGYRERQHLQQEIYDIIRAGLPDSAEINYNGPTQPSMIIPEHNERQSKRILKRIKDSITAYLQNQFEDRNIKVETGVVLIREEGTAHDHFDKLEQVFATK